METFPNIQPGQFVVLFVDRKTGHVYDIDLQIFDERTSDTQKVYYVSNSLSDAKTYADKKTIADIKTHIDFGYLIYDHNETVVILNDR